jgi:DHA2 family methylenomycin A resistance protein-like MFS transporter
MMLVPLNSTMLAVALPSVMADFDVDAGAVAALVSVYLGTMVVALPLAGAAGDRLGHRRTFLAGVVGFALASLLAAAASAFWLLVLARVLQAASGSLISTSAAALVRAAAPEDRRGAAFGTFDMLVTVSAAIGPFAGGLIVGALDWRWMFVLAVPVATAAALSVITLPIQRAAGHDAATPQRFSPINPGLFLRRGYAAAVAGILGATVIIHGSFILVPFMVERLMDGNATTSGLVLLGISGVSALTAPIGGRTSDTVGRRRPAVIGALVTAAGLGALALLISGSVAPDSAVPVALLLGVVGAGFGLAGSPRQAAALEAVASHEVGVAAATYYTGRYLGGLLGASLAGLVLAGSVSAGSVALGFGIFAAVAVAVALVSLALPGRVRGVATPDRAARSGH